MNGNTLNKKKVKSIHARIVKDINERLVLRLIQKNDIISSSELAQKTGMRPSTIFNILKLLSAQSFISFYGKGNSTKKGGKKPFIWTLNKDAAYTIGLDIEVGEMTFVILDFRGNIVEKKNFKFEKGYSADELTTHIIKFVDDVIIKKVGLDKDKIFGMGVAFAGIVDSHSGIVALSSVLSETNLSFLEKLKTLPFPVLIENNANAAAIGFKWKNRDIGMKNYLTVLVEMDTHVSGLGIGIVIDGELYRGSSFCAGELNAHLPDLIGILSSFRSRFAESDVLKKYVSSFESIDIDFLLDIAKSGDPIARQIFAKIGNIVGKAIAPAVALLNPDALIITGNVSELEDVIIEAVRKEIEMEVISITNNTLRVLVDKHHHYSVAVGAASLILDDFFKIPSMK
jgi:predicted NBD/HSP70 family sugar kinase